MAKLLRKFFDEVIPDVEPLEELELRDLIWQFLEPIVPEVEFGDECEFGDGVDVAYPVPAQLEPLEVGEVVSDDLDVGQFVVGQLHVLYVVHAVL